MSATELRKVIKVLLALAEQLPARFLAAVRTEGTLSCDLRMRNPAGKDLHVNIFRSEGEYKKP